MRWIEVVLFCAVLTIVFAEPDPKKYKPEIKSKDKDKPHNANLTDEERTFLRDIETKFGLKTETPAESTSKNDKEDKKSVNLTKVKLPFPAVIAIEIVNDTDIKNGKNKRTIDANLGYGYRTNTGYSYSYFGKPSQDKGKFMIYPYSQEDIPPPHLNVHASGYSHNTHPNVGYTKTDVEITPSQAFELVPTKEETNSYHYEKPAIKYEEGVQSVETPPSAYSLGQSAYQHTPTTLYTTYNGQQFSGLSVQFPSVMSNYFVDPSQLLKNPQYQSAGLTQDHLRSHGAQLDQRVVPVLVLRVPSSYLKNPSAELYANLPQNYPYSQHLNHVNLQELVNQYFKKLGYNYAPQVMTYPSSPLQSENTASSHLSGHDQRQHYSSPYMQPSYTQSDYSGVQYSAVKPVMAKYPTGYSSQYYRSQSQSHYPHEPQQHHQQQYVYRYQYAPQMSSQSHHNYDTSSVPQYQQSYQVNSQEDQQEQAAPQQSAEVHDDSRSAYEHSSVSGDTSQESLANTDAQTATGGYEQSHPYSATPSYQHVEATSAENEASQEVSDYSSSQQASPYHGSSVQVQYDSSEQKEPIDVYPRSQTGHRYSSQITNTHAVSYQNQAAGNSDNSLVLTENYPSKDHTIATVLPLSYRNRHPQSQAVQSVSYVTPVPHTMKYHSQYRVMVPQTVFRSPSSEQTTYVHSHAYNSAAANPEAEYTVSSHYSPPISRQKPPHYPRNYHSSPKRTVRQDTPKSESLSTLKKVNENNDNKKSA